MKKIFMMLLMAVAAVSTWGQEENEYYDVEQYYKEQYKNKSLRQRYIEFLFGGDEKETIKTYCENIRRRFTECESYVYDEQNGLIVSVRVLPKEKVLREYQKHLLSLRECAKERKDDRIVFNYNALYNGLFENTLHIPNKIGEISKL